MTSQSASQSPASSRFWAWPAYIVFATLILPREVRFELGTVILYADRIGLLMVLPVTIMRLVRRQVRMNAIDALVLFSMVWIAISMLANMGIGNGLQAAMSMAIDGQVAYFAARVSFPNGTAFRSFLAKVAPVFLMISIAIMIESITFTPFVRPTASAIFGALPVYADGQIAGVDDRQFTRLFLLRAQGPFSHPILAGLLIATLLPLYQLGTVSRRQRLSGVIAAHLAFFTVSSAALVSLAFGYSLMIYRRLVARTTFLSWQLLLLVLVIGLVGVEIISNRGAFGFLGSVLALDPATAYYRTLIWKFGTLSVNAHPWLGIGYSSFRRPVWMVSGSIDAHWLYLAIRNGLPLALAQAAALIATVAMLFRRGTASRSRIAEQNNLLGMAFSLTTFGILLFTVALWAGALNWYHLLLGGCVSAAFDQLRDSKRA